MRALPVRASRMRRVCCGLAIAAALSTSACAAGQRAQTADQKPTLDGTEASVGNLDLRGIAIAAPTSAPSYSPGQSAQLHLVVVNSGTATDRLTSITSSAIAGWGSYAQQAQPAAPPTTLPITAAPTPTPSRSVTIPVGGLTSWGVPDTKRTLVLTGLRQRLFPGTSVRLTFGFARAGNVTVTVPVALTTNPSYSYVPEPKNAEASATA